MFRRPKARGFTMIELMAVVAIIGVLAAISVPKYTTYIDRSKAAEALIQLETIGYLEQVHLLEMGRTLACPPEPPNVPGTTKVTFTSSSAWAELGFGAAGPVRFQYEVTTPGAKEFVARARGDLDGDGQLSEYTLDGARMEIVKKNPYE